MENLFIQFNTAYIDAIFKLPTFYPVMLLFLHGIGYTTRPKQLVFRVETSRALAFITINNCLLMPIIVSILCFIVNPPGLITLSLFLICACQGGRFAFIITWALNGNIQLQFWQIIFARIFSVVTTPAIFMIFSYVNPNTRALMVNLEFDYFAQIINVLFLFIIPFLSGVTISALFPHISAILAKPFNVIGVLFLSLFIMLDIQTNTENFELYWTNYFYLVMLHNLIALVFTYILARLIKLDHPSAITASLASGTFNFVLAISMIKLYYASYNIMFLVIILWSWSSTILPFIFGLLRISYLWLIKLQSKTSHQVNYN